MTKNAEIIKTKNQKKLLLWLFDMSQSFSLIEQSTSETISASAAVFGALLPADVLVVSPAEDSDTSMGSLLLVEASSVVALLC